MVEPLARENMPHCFYGHLQETRPTDLGIDKVISTAICLSPRPNPKKKINNYRANSRFPIQTNSYRRKKSNRLCFGNTWYT